MEPEISFVLDHVGSFFRLLPIVDQEKLKTIWMGYVQLCSDNYLSLFQTSYSKGLGTAHHRYNKTWQYFEFWHECDLQDDPKMKASGRGAANFIFSWDEERINCTWERKSDIDKLFFPLISEFDSRINTYFEFTFSTPVTGSLGGLVGYFNNQEKHLENSIFAGFANENLLLGINNSDDTLLLDTSGPVLEANHEYVVAVWWDAIDRLLRANCYHASSGRSVTTESINVSGILTLSIPLTGNFNVNQFSVANIDLHNHVEDFYHAVGLIVDESVGGSTGYISRLRFMDPTLHRDLYSIPTLQSQIYDPIITLTEGITGDYWRYGSALWFKEYPPPSPLWSRNAYFSNRLLEDNFGSLVNYFIAPKSYVTKDYLVGLKGLFYSYFGGPTISNIERGIKIVLNLPILEKEARVKSIEINSIFNKGWEEI